MKKVGLTGGIGSGKTTVSRIFKTLGIPVYNSDQEAKKLMNEDCNLVKTIRNTFGEKAYDMKGHLDSKFLAEIVFHDKKALGLLNSIVHPVVRADFEKWMLLQDTQFVIQESAILIESGLYEQFHFVISVVAPIKERMERVMERDRGITREQIEARIAVQISDEIRRKFSHVVLRNGKDDLLLPQIVTLKKKIEEIC